MDRRSALKLMAAGGFFGLTKLVRASEEFGPELEFRSGFVGCVGRSRHPDLTRKILSRLSSYAALADRGDPHPLVRGGTMAMMGGITVPEQQAAFQYAQQAMGAYNRNDFIFKCMEGKERAIDGLKEVWSYMNYMTWCAAIGGGGGLHLLNENDRLYVIDCRMGIGQIFFAQSDDHIRQATADIEPSLLPEKIIEFNESQMWHMRLEEVGQTTAEDKWFIKKFKVTKTRYLSFHEEKKEEETPDFDLIPLTF